MGHSYYSYTKEELVGNGPKLPVIVMEDNAEVFHSMAVEMVDEIRKHNETEEKTVQLVKNCLDQKFYIKKIMRDCAELQIYRQLMQHPHPGIPMLYEATRRGETCILVEEFINGTTLEYVLSERSLDDAAIHHIMQQLLSAVEHLHSLQPPVIHRDIKPGNIMVLEHLEIRLIDFEIARVFKQDKNRDTRVMGSAGYASPEQYGFHQSDCRSDIYAIGAVLKTMVQKDVTAKDIHSPFQHIIETCMQLDPDKRYQSVGELQKALGYCEEKSLPHASVSVLLSQLPGIRRDSAAKRLLFLAYYGLCIILGASMTVTLRHPRIH